MVSEKKSRKTNPFTIATNKQQHKQKEQKPFGKKSNLGCERPPK